MRGLLVALAVCAASGAARKYEGVKVRIVMSEWAMRPFGPYVQQFYDETGCNVTLVRDDSASLLPRIQADAESGFGDDGYMILAADLPQLAREGYILDLTERIRVDDRLAWDDVLPFYREFNTAFNKRTYGIPSDGGLLGMFGRSDLVPRGQEPQTIDSLLEMVKQFDGKDLNGDGIPDRGWCECVGPTNDILTTLVNGDYVMQFIATYMQSKGPRQGVWFDPVTMQTRIDHEGFREGFTKAVAVWQAGTRFPDNECNRHPDSTSGMNIPRLRWANGTCAFSINWQGGILRDVYIEGTYASDKVRMFPFPGSDKVDIDGKLTSCGGGATVCPYATKGRDGRQISSAPFAALGGGYAMLIGEHSRNVDATYDFMAFLNEPVRSNEWVTDRFTATFEPFRQSHLFASGWEKQWGKAIADEFIEATRTTNVGDKNIAPDVMLPEAVFYPFDMGGVFMRAVQGEISIDEALVALADKWMARIEKNGFEKVRDLYRETIGLGPYVPPPPPPIVNDALESWHYALIGVAAGVVCLVIALLVFKYRKSQAAYRKQFDNNVVAERCAKAIASMQLEEVEYLKELERPNTIQASFIEIVNRLNQYKAYMPQSLFKRDEEQDEADDGKSVVSSSSRKTGSTARSASSRKTGSTAGSIAELRKRVNLSTELGKRQVSLFVTNVQGFTAAARSWAPAKIVAQHKAYLEHVLRAVNTNRGIIDEMVGDKVHASFNTAQPTAQHKTFALNCVIDMKRLEDIKVNMAAVSGSALCGNIGCTGFMRYAIISRPSAFVWTYERWSKAWGICNLVDAALCANAIGFDFRFVARSQVSTSSATHLYEVMAKKEAVEDEWMYQLEKDAASQMYTHYNDAVVALYKGEFAEATKLAQQSSTPFDDDLLKRIAEHMRTGKACKPIPVVLAPSPDTFFTEADYSHLPADQAKEVSA
eukprot:TRINITY_DN3102_c0_g2_i2.p1 TRINITY_DN3102_c0_g2~~TRINITY_DN3102_c0_g2_i2.p1  ORF type:complete len:952 (+),score=317.12 TRINITY_DN3102_c0_g2_i2:59-2857(+)